MMAELVVAPMADLMAAQWLDWWLKLMAGLMGKVVCRMLG